MEDVAKSFQPVSFPFHGPGEKTHQMQNAITFNFARAWPVNPSGVSLTFVIFGDTCLESALRVRFEPGSTKRDVRGEVPVPSIQLAWRCHRHAYAAGPLPPPVGARSNVELEIAG